MRLLRKISELLAVLALVTVGAAPAIATPATPEILSAPTIPEAPTVPQQSSDPLSVELTLPEGAIIKPDEPLSLQATITNSSDSAITVESAEIGSSRSILTSSLALYSWLDGTLSDIHIASLPLDSPASISAHQSISASLSLSPEDRAWYTERFFWGARGLSIHVTASSLSSASATDLDHAEPLTLEAYDRSVAVSIPNEDLPRFPMSAAVVCKPSLEQLSSLASPLESLIGFDNSSASIPDSAEEELGTDTISPLWDTAGVNLFLEPIMAADAAAVTASGTTGTDSSSVPPIPSAPTLPQLSSAALYSLPAYNADLHALSHSDSAGLMADIIAEGDKARSAVPAFSDTLYTPIFDAPDTELLSLIAQSQLGTPILPSDSLTYQESYFFPDSMGKVAVYTAASDTQAHPQEQPSAIPALMANSVLSSIMEGSLTLEYGNDAVGNEAVPLSAAKIAPTALAYSAILYNQAPSYTRSTVALLSVDCSDTTMARNTAAVLAAPWLTPASLENLTQPAKESQALGEFTEEYVWEIATASDDGIIDATHLESESTAASHSDASSRNIEIITQFLQHKDELAAALPSDSDFSSHAERYAYSLLNQEWNTHSAEHHSRIAELNIPAFIRAHIQIQEASKITIISESSNLPVRIHSDFNVPVEAALTMSASDNRLAVENVDAVILAPRSTTTISIPVTAQGSGFITANSFVQIPDSPLSTASTQLNIRLHAGWETAGTAIIASAVGIVFLVGIVRSVRAGRRSQPISNDQFTEGLRNAHRSHRHYQTRHKKE